ncbi:hypothetical protein [Dyadobacter sp. LHD-138]|nr:hypothetical protein [Dyadobacter sp. LHD-138]MDQ6481595.1 hypothetical protein [Dyadobacter sp. LHD-138]
MVISPFQGYDPNVYRIFYNNIIPSGLFISFDDFMVKIPFFQNMTMKFVY